LRIAEAACAASPLLPLSRNAREIVAQRKRDSLLGHWLLVEIAGVANLACLPYITDAHPAYCAMPGFLVDTQDSVDF